MKILKSIFALGSVLVLAILSTNAYFVSQVRVNSNVFSTGHWYVPPRVVINEVYYWPDEAHRLPSDKEGKNEWIELYNTTGSPVNVKNWQIKTDNYTRTITANKTIPAYGFLMLSHDSSTWAFWTLPAGTEKADLGTAPNDYMRTSDTIRLYDDEGNLIDQLSYTGGQEGHSFERDPKGSNNIVDRITPTPGY